MIDTALDVAREAGALLLERFGRLSGAEVSRKGPRDFVTAADRDAEAHIVARLREAFPDHAILAEEGGRHDAAGAPTWIVDPLDGTTNFLHGIPVFAVSLGLVEAGRPVLGVVHAPALGQTFWGAPGQGAHEGDRPVSVSVTPMLSEALVATGFAYAIDAVPDDNLDNLARVAKVTRGLRRLGSAALDLAYVASGRFDAYWELHLSPWDVAGGAALVLAAGGRVTDFRGGEDWLFGRHLVASNGLVHEALRTSLSPLRGL
ncbi:MAG: inositol monophosphatase [Planctomycetes bacterium]|nr:inositol monophosphatase [Planctomycetota bacterium]